MGNKRNKKTYTHTKTKGQAKGKYTVTIGK